MPTSKFLRFANAERIDEELLYSRRTTNYDRRCGFFSGIFLLQIPRF